MPIITQNEDGSFTLELNAEAGDFAGGRNEQKNIGPTESRLALNVYNDESQNLRVRPSVRYRGTMPIDLSKNFEARKTFQYTKSDGTPWLAVSGRELSAGVYYSCVYITNDLNNYIQVPNTTATGALYLDSAYDISMASLNGKLYMLNGVDYPHVFDGAATIQKNDFDELKTEFGLTYNNCMWLFKPYSASTKAYYSDVDGNFNALSFVDFQSPASGKITGAQISTAGMLITKEDCEIAFTGYSPETFQQVIIGFGGGSNNDSMCNVNNTIVYIGAKENEFRISDGLRTAPLDNNLPVTMANISQSGTFKMFEKTINGLDMFSPLMYFQSSVSMAPYRTVLDPNKLYDGQDAYSVYPDYNNYDTLYNGKIITTPGSILTESGTATGWTIVTSKTKAMVYQYAPSKVTTKLNLEHTDSDYNSNGHVVEMGSGTDAAEIGAIPNLILMQVMDMSENVLYSKTFSTTDAGLDDKYYWFKEDGFFGSHDSGRWAITQFDLSFMAAYIEVTHNIPAYDYQKVKVRISLWGVNSIVRNTIVDGYGALDGSEGWTSMKNTSIGGTSTEQYRNGVAANVLISYIESDMFVLQKSTDGQIIGCQFSRTPNAKTKVGSFSRWGSSEDVYHQTVDTQITLVYGRSYVDTVKSGYNITQYDSNYIPVTNPIWGTFEIGHNLSSINLALADSSSWGGDWCVAVDATFSQTNTGGTTIRIYEGSSNLPNSLSASLQTHDPNYGTATPSNYVQFKISIFPCVTGSHVLDTVNPKRYRQPKVFDFSFSWYFTETGFLLSKHNMTAVQWKKDKELLAFTKNGDGQNNYIICLDRILEKPRYHLWRMKDVALLFKFAGKTFCVKNTSEIYTIDEDYKIFSSDDTPFFWETDSLEDPQGSFKCFDEIELIMNLDSIPDKEIPTHFLLVEVWIDGKYAGTVPSDYFRKTSMLGVFTIPAGIVTNESTINFYNTQVGDETGVIGYGKEIKFKILFTGAPDGKYGIEMIRAIRVKYRTFPHMFIQPGLNAREGTNE